MPSCHPLTPAAIVCLASFARSIAPNRRHNLGVMEGGEREKNAAGGEGKESRRRTRRWWKKPLHGAAAIRQAEIFHRGGSYRVAYSSYVLVPETCHIANIDIFVATFGCLRIIIIIVS